VPCLFLAFFDFTSNPNLNSLNDNKLKTEISAIRTALQSSEYKTRFAVVLLSDKTILEAPDIEDRLATIRRATGLDPKTGIFFLPPSPSRVEITSFITSLLTTVQPVCIEYYRDLIKHSRRKKNRGNAPAPTLPPTRTTSHPLSSHGWAIRYDIKLGVFAEFRQEMDAACRHYTSALESLMGAEGVFETTVSWSPRWDEGRILADMMAFRIIRCLLWSQLTTTATQSWINYRDRMHELVDRRGKGSSNYGWEAWESRWAKIMAELIQRADIPAISVIDSIDMTTSMILAKSENTTFLPPEKVFVGVERIPPWHHMHHPGYWMRMSARSAKRRLRYANAVPEEDRAPPQQSPASSVAQRSRTYDTYLCPWPHEECSYPSPDGFDHGKDIIDRLQTATKSFNGRKQKRFADRLDLEIGRELLRKQDYEGAVQHLRPIWEDCSWRREKWWLPLFELNRIMAECARQAGDIPALTSALFELHAPYLRLVRDMRIDLMDCVKTAKASDSEAEKPKVELSPNSVASFRK
jgi:trafficking protein particle complex subunit 11